MFEERVALVAQDENRETLALGDAEAFFDSQHPERRRPRVRMHAARVDDRDRRHTTRHGASDTRIDGVRDAAVGRVAEVAVAARGGDASRGARKHPMNQTLHVFT